jgi:cytoskeletal protein CcmA (bactofilin family)
MSTIYLPGSRVTVGRNGQVSADICAREMVVWERCMATLMPVDRVSISSGGSSIGNEITQRVSIVEGASSRASSTFTRQAQEMMEWWLRGSPPPTHPGAAFAIQA